MMKLLNDKAFSYRANTSVPSFDDAGPVVFMDGDCALCSVAARVIARWDKRREFRICTVQSRLGQAMLRHYGLNPEDPDSWLYLFDGRAYTSLDAIIRAGRRLGGFGRVFGVFAILPSFMQDWIYRRLALNRYAVFGRANMCALPDKELVRRLIS